MTPELHSFLTIVTDLGDSSVILLIVMLGVAYLTYCRCGRGAIALVIAFFTSAIGIGLSKLFLLGCNADHDYYGIHSPSGHAALSLAVYGTLAALLASQSKGWVRWLSWITASALIAVIALSRVLLTFHTTGEVVTGLLIGGIAVTAACLFLFYKRKKLPPFNALPLLLAIIATAFVLHGIRLPAEAFIRFIAERLKFYMPLCNS